MDAVFRHFVEYDVDSQVMVSDSVKSLEANDRLLKQAILVIEKLVPGLVLEYKSVSVPVVTQQSPLTEVFALAVVMTFQEKLSVEVPALVKSLTGVEVPHEYNTLLTVIVMMIAIMGIGRALDVLFPGRDKAAVDATQHELARKAGDILNKSPEAVETVVSDGFSGKMRRSLISNAQKLFAPTRGSTSATLRGRDGQVLIAPPAVTLAQAAAGLPIEVDVSDSPPTTSELKTGVEIILHAMDRDSKRSGWAAHIPNLSDDRIAMKLEKTISPESLFGREKIRGDILLVSQENDDGEMIPNEFLLLRAYI